MSIDVSPLIIDGLAIRIVRRRIRHLYFGVYPPDGQVRVTAPMAISVNAIRLAIIGKLGWIQRQRARINSQPRQPQGELVDGETCYLWGRPYRLAVMESAKSPEVRLQDDAILVLQVKAGLNLKTRRRILDDWYRSQIMAEAQNLIARWTPVVGVQVAEWGIKRMKTRWGSCNVRVRRIWLNLELAKRPLPCLELIVVHEMAHLLEPRHNAHFKMLMSKFLPDWKARRAELNRISLRHEL